MIICGLDLSTSSSGCVKFELDDKTLEIIQSDFMGFTDKVYQSGHPNLIPYKKKGQFNNYLERNAFHRQHIVNFAKGAEYIGIEDYAIAGKGRVYHIGEFAGGVKTSLVIAHGCKVRLNEPLTIKMFAGSGKFDKGGMKKAYDEFDEPNSKFDFSDSKIFRPITNSKKGSAPMSDIIDAWWIAKLLQRELQIRAGLIQVRDLPKNQIAIYNRVTKTYPENVLVRDFLGGEHDS